MNTLKFFSLILLINLAACTAKQSNEEKSDESKMESGKKLFKLATSDDLFRLISQNWEIDDVDGPLPKDLFDRTDEGIANQPGLCFLTDSSIVENPRGEIRMGKFSLKEQRIVAKFDDGKLVEYSIVQAVPYKLTLKRAEAGKITTLKLGSEGRGYIDPLDNPFHPDNNQWRIKPKDSEDDAALKIRLANNVLFYQKFFQDHVNRDAQAISFEGIPSCLNWYQGGITIQGEAKVDKKWVACFYSKEDALRARDILEKSLMRKHKWDTSITNWVEQMVPVLRSVRDSL